MKLALGDTVKFTAKVSKRSGDKVTATAKGKIVSFAGHGNIVASVDFAGTWFPHEETGSPVRTVPVANLYKVCP